jgi:hypothetical protein
MRQCCVREDLEGNRLQATLGKVIWEKDLGLESGFVMKTPLRLTPQVKEASF